LTPAVAKPAKRSASAEFGLASRVISNSGAVRQWRLTRSMRAAAEKDRDDLMFRCQLHLPV
jgi:hypothetical protein